MDNNRMLVHNHIAYIYISSNIRTDKLPILLGEMIRLGYRHPVHILTLSFSCKPYAPNAFLNFNSPCSLSHLTARMQATATE